MKILLLTELYDPIVNGVITSVKSLKYGLEQKGHEVRILTLGSKTSYDSTQGVYYLSSYRVPFIYPGARVNIHPDLALYLDILNWGPDIIHTQNEFSTFRVARHLHSDLGASHIHTYHTVYEDYTHYFTSSPRIGKRMVAQATKILLNRVDQVIVPSEKVANLLLSYQVHAPIHIIPSGIQLNQFQQQASLDDIHCLKQSLGIPEDTFIALYLGRLAKEKNIHELLAYIQQMKQPNFHFLIVGNGPDRDCLEAQVQAASLSQRVTFAGQIPADQVGKYYQLADVFLTASTSETQGLTYIESLASGTPVICREDPVIDAIVVDGWTGYQYRNFSEFEQAFQALATNPGHLKELGTNAQRFAMETYSSEAFAERVEACYDEALSQNTLSFHY